MNENVNRKNNRKTEKLFYGFSVSFSAPFVVNYIVVFCIMILERSELSRAEFECQFLAQGHHAVSFGFRRISLLAMVCGRSCPD